jgi:LysM repeat protein
MVAGSGSRLVRMLSLVFLAGAIITGLMAVTRTAGAPHGALAATVAHPSRDAAHPSRDTAPHRRQAEASPRPRHTADASHVARLRRTHKAMTARTYAVRPGDTLSSIAERCYGTADDWTALYHANTARISDPDLIYSGQVLTVPAEPTALTAYAAGTDSGVHAAASEEAHRATVAGEPGAVASDTAWRGGPYGCAALEGLWDKAGGSPGQARTAAEIALAESGGNPDAVSPTNDYGLWQVNASNGSLATLNPRANARSAVVISRDGADWSAWTTYRDGGFEGRC